MQPERSENMELLMRHRIGLGVVLVLQTAVMPLHYGKGYIS